MLGSCSTTDTNSFSQRNPFNIFLTLKKKKLSRYKENKKKRSFSVSDFILFGQSLTTKPWLAQNSHRPTCLCPSAPAMLGLKALLHHTYSEINLRFVFMLYFAFMYVCVPHTYRVPIKSEESIGFPKTE